MSFSRDFFMNGPFTLKKLITTEGADSIIYTQ